MALSASKQIAKLRAEIEAAARDVLENNVAPVIKEEILNQSQRAYDDYSPEKYVRTGGLTNEDNIEVEISSNNELQVFFNYKTDDGYDIPIFVAESSGYRWSNAIDERPIMEWAREELASNGKVSDAFRKGLKEQGIKVK